MFSSPSIRFGLAKNNDKASIYGVVSLMAGLFGAVVNY